MSAAAASRLRSVHGGPGLPAFALPPLSDSRKSLALARPALLPSVRRFLTGLLGANGTWSGIIDVFRYSWKKYWEVFHSQHCHFFLGSLLGILAVGQASRWSGRFLELLSCVWEELGSKHYPPRGLTVQARTGLFPESLCVTSPGSWPRPSPFYIFPGQGSPLSCTAAL